MHLLDKAAATFGDLFICAKNLFVEAMDAKKPRPFDGPGQVKAERVSDQFGPSRSAFTGRAEPFLVALPTC